MSNTWTQKRNALHPRKVKQALYNDQSVEHRGWLIRINANDMIEVFPPENSHAPAFEAPLGHLDKVVASYCKNADMPIPGVNETQGDQVSVPAPKTLLGPDSSQAEGPSAGNPTVNKRPKGTDPKGTSAPDTNLGKDTSGKNPSNFNPAVNKRPGPQIERGGLPNTELGPDSQGNATKWRDKKVKIKDDGRMAQHYSDDDYSDADFSAEDPDYLVDLWINGQAMQVVDTIGDDLPLYTEVLERLEDQDMREEAEKLQRFVMDTHEARRSAGLDGTDEDSAYDLFLTAGSNGDIYELKMNIWNNLRKHMNREQYDPQLAVKGLMHWIDAGAQEYAASSGTGLPWHKMFPKNIRMMAAQMAVEQFESEGPEMFEEEPAEDEGFEPEARRQADEFDVTVQERPQEKPPKGGEPSNVDDFIQNEEQIRTETEGTEGKKSHFVDKFDKPRIDASEVYRKLTAKRPSEALLSDIMDPQKWASNNLFMPKKATYDVIVDGKHLRLRDPNSFQDAEDTYDELVMKAEELGGINSIYLLEDGEELAEWGEGPDIDDRDIPNNIDIMNWEASKKKSHSRRQAGPRLRENWGGDGAYGRDLEAESSEQLHALTLALSGQDIDWSQYAPTTPQEALEGDALDAGGEAPGGGAAIPTPVAANYSGTNVEDAQSTAGKLAKDWMEGTEGAVISAVSMDPILALSILNVLPGEAHEGFIAAYEEVSPNVNVAFVKSSMAGDSVEADCGECSEREDKEAVDPAAKGYWSGYFGDYGKQLTRDDTDAPESKPSKKKDKGSDKGKDARVAAWRRARKAARIAQAAPPAGPPAGPGGANAAPVAAPGAPPAPAPAPGAPAPGAAPAPGGAPAAPPSGSGDQGLQTLGWTPADINVMDPEDKQKILQYKIKKPGTPKGPVSPNDPAAPGKPPAPAPAAPGGAPAPGAPPVAPPVPGKPVAPAPASRATAKLLMMKFNRRIKLAQVAPTSPAANPATAAPSPLATPVAPGASQTAPPAGGAGKAPAVPVNPGQNPSMGNLPSGSDPGESESKTAEDAFQILAEVQQMAVQATSPEQVTSMKSGVLAERLIKELGVTMQEARELYGLSKSQSFTTLLK